MEQRIFGYHKDEENHWVAELSCGHFQHVRHNPPWINRPWVETDEGRVAMLDTALNCKKCDDGAPPDSLESRYTWKSWVVFYPFWGV